MTLDSDRPEIRWWVAAETPQIRDPQIRRGIDNAVYSRNRRFGKLTKKLSSWVRTEHGKIMAQKAAADKEKLEYGRGGMSSTLRC